MHWFLILSFTLALSFGDLISRKCICTTALDGYKECYFDFQCNITDAHCRNCEGVPDEKSKKDSKDPVKILMYNNVNDDVSFYRDELVVGCSTPCKFYRATYGKPLSYFDGVIYSVIKWDLAFPPKPPGQIWIAHCGESILSYYGRHLRNENYMKNFELKALYKKDSNMHFNYLEFDYGTAHDYVHSAGLHHKNQR